MEFNETDKNECVYNTNGICSPKEILEKIGEALEIDPDDPDQLIFQAKEQLGCETESCVIKRTLNDSTDVLDKYFKPPGPRNTTDLLDNFNIDNVLEMWAKKFDGFYHMYYQMIDFEDCSTELANVDLLELKKKGYKSLGVVLNTDVHTGRGIHWFCLFCNLTSNPMTVEFFNSSGQSPRPEMHAWFIKIKRIMPVKIIIVSNIKHQKDTESECGPYSLYYIWSRLNGIPHKVFNEKRIKDSKMIEFRKTLFRKE